MGRFKDLTGQKFGRLTVIEKAENDKYNNVRYLCKCECDGKEIIVNGSSLRSGNTKSCGCIKIKNLIGKKFGRWTVIEMGEDYISPSGHKETRWWCQCDCGSENSLKLVLGSHLKDGTSQSCGCWKKDKYDLTGEKFGRLIVIKKVGKPSNRSNNQSYWLCKCNCGSEKEIITGIGDLKSGNTQSCGCLQQEMASKANKKYNIYDFSGEYGIGYTLKGEEFYFDLEDYDKIKDYCWFKNEDGYIIAGDLHEKGFVWMHRLVMDCPDDMEVDHKFQRTYDNRKEFLRYATRSQNAMNIGLRSSNTSGVTGVSWDKKSEKWRSYIGKNNEKINLGYYDDFNEAVEIRKQAEEKYFGKYRYIGEAIND